MTWAILMAAGNVLALIVGVAMGRRRFCGCGHPRASQEALKLAHDSGHAMPVCLNCRRILFVDGLP